MHKLLQFLVVGFVISLLNHAVSVAQADHWYVPDEGQGFVYSHPAYAQPQYTQSHYAQPVYSQPIYVAPVTLVARTSVIVAQPVYVQRVYAQPVAVFAEPVYLEPAVVSHRVLVPAPIYSRPIVSAPYKVREEIKSRPGHYEYEQKGKFRVYNEGMRPKTYRYEYEVDQRHGRTKTKFDIRD